MLTAVRSFYFTSSLAIEFTKRAEASIMQNVLYLPDDRCNWVDIVYSNTAISYLGTGWLTFILSLSAISRRKKLVIGTVDRTLLYSNVEM